MKKIGETIGYIIGHIIAVVVVVIAIPVICVKSFVLGFKNSRRYEMIKTLYGEEALHETVKRELGLEKWKTWLVNRFM